MDYVKERGTVCQLSENYQFKIFPVYGYDFRTKSLLCIQTNITETVNNSEMISERINMVAIHSVTGHAMSNKILKLFEQARHTAKRAQKDMCYLNKIFRAVPSKHKCLYGYCSILSLNLLA